MAIMTFSRGDGVTKKCLVPATSWSAGGRLFFAAKQSFDDDLTDSKAEIDISWGDDVISPTDVVKNGISYKQYNCYFPPSATSSITSDGAGIKELKGEFQYVPNGGDPVTAPALDENKIQVLVYIDIKRKTTV